MTTPYVRTQKFDALDQGDIIDGCPLFRLSPTHQFVDFEASPLRWFSRVIVLTQACDLANAKTAKVLVAAIHLARDLVENGILKAATVRDQVRRGSVYGWYFLPADGAGLNIDESIADLRELHTVSRTVLEQRIAEGRRAGRLATPFREHLAQHFAVTYMRIGLPEPYETTD